jgi:lipopolysaccharide export system protein LptA
LTPPQLLEKTQEAVGEKRLYEMQQKLIDLRNKQKALQHVSSFNTLAIFFLSSFSLDA